MEVDAETVQTGVTGALGVALGLFARVVAFPLATLRRRHTADTPDDDPSGFPYVPKPVQKAAALTLTVALGVGAGQFAGVEALESAHAALSAFALAMIAFDVQTKRAPRAPAAPSSPPATTAAA